MNGLAIQQVQTFVLSKDAFFAITGPAASKSSTDLDVGSEFTEQFTLADLWIRKLPTRSAGILPA